MLSDTTHTSTLRSPRGDAKNKAPIRAEADARADEPGKVNGGIITNNSSTARDRLNIRLLYECLAVICALGGKHIYPPILIPRKRPKPPMHDGVKLPPAFFGR